MEEYQQGKETEAIQASFGGETRTVHFCVDGGGVGGRDHHAGLLGQLDEEIMDFVQIGFRHRCSRVCTSDDL